MNIALRTAGSFVRITSSKIAVMAPMVLLMSVAVGVNVGYNADSASDAKIVEGEDYELDNLREEHQERQRFDLGQRVPSLETRHEGDSWMGDAVRSFTKDIVRVAMGAASAVSVWTYQNRSWLNPACVNWALNGAAVVYVTSVTAYFYRRVSPWR